MDRTSRIRSVSTSTSEPRRPTDEAVERSSSTGREDPDRPGTPLGAADRGQPAGHTPTPPGGLQRDVVLEVTVVVGMRAGDIQVRRGQGRRYKGRTAAIVRITRSRTRRERSGTSSWNQGEFNTNPTTGSRRPRSRRPGPNPSGTTRPPVEWARTVVTGRPGRSATMTAGLIQLVVVSLRSVMK